MAENELTKWVVGAVLIGITGMLGFLARFVFGRNVIDRIDNIDKKNDAGFERVFAKIEGLSNAHHSLDQRLALGAQTFKRQDDDLTDLKEEIREMKKIISQIRYKRVTDPPVNR